MGQDWRIEGPRVLDVGGEQERVTALRVGVVGGRVDVVTHDDSPTARVEVAGVEGAPLRVRWDGSTLRITHGRDTETGLIDMIRRQFDDESRNRVTISVSVPVQTRATISTVTATALLSGLRGNVRANTVSGTLTLSELTGDIDLNTVSGNVECHELVGPLNVNAVSGSVTAQASSLPRVRINTVSGDVTLDLTNERAEIRSNSVSGDVTVRAPHSGFDVSARTASGQVVVDGRLLDGSESYGDGGHGPRAQHGKGGRLSEGDGGLQVRANAVSGNVVVLRAGSPTRRAPDGADLSPQDGPYSPGPAPQDAPPGSDPQDGAGQAGTGGTDPAGGAR